MSIVLRYSLRWRLALSYAAIAFLTALTLGAVLLTLLHGDYAERERALLQRNANAAAQTIGARWDDYQSAQGIQEITRELRVLAYFPHIRIQLLDIEQQVLADTGEPDEAYTIIFSDYVIHPHPQMIVVEKTPGAGYGITAAGQTRIQQHSNQSVTVVVRDAYDHPVGYIRASGGAAIGSEVLASVWQRWLYAGGAAVALAIVTGWVTSRRITRPLLLLTEATTRMAAGDLSARTELQRRDEMGELAGSFNTMAERIQGTVTTLQCFVADAAHELHTPLTVLRTDLELIGEAHETLDTRRSLQQVHRLQTLADNLLILSRIESGNPAVARQSVDLRQILQEVSAGYASQAEQAGIEFTLELSESVAPIWGYPDRLAGMVSNLLDNAVKFTPSGGTITVSLQQTEPELVLTVQDTGIGIPNEDLPFIFHRFRRGRNTASYPGSGLGLAIVQAIVQTYNGQIQAEQASPGVKITVTFPKELRT